jgi:hypothetical protein
VLGVERDQQRDERVPRVGSSRTDDVAAYFTFDPAASRIMHRRVVHRRVDIHRISFPHRLVTIRRLVITLGGGFEDARVEHTHVAGKSGDHQVLVEGGNRSCGQRATGVHQNFEPFAEAIDVEPMVASRPRVTP